MTGPTHCGFRAKLCSPCRLSPVEGKVESILVFVPPVAGLWTSSCWSPCHFKVGPGQQCDWSFCPGCCESLATDGVFSSIAAWPTWSVVPHPPTVASWGANSLPSFVLQSRGEVPFHPPPWNWAGLSRLDRRDGMELPGLGLHRPAAPARSPALRPVE